MSNLGRQTGMFALAVLTLTIALATPAYAQVSAVKDGWLVMKIHSDLVDEDVLSGSNIDVDVKNGVVTLQGTVPSEAGRARAIAEAKKTDGVKNVVDQMRIAPAAGGTMDKAQDKTATATQKTGRAIDDGWIKSKIYAQYLADWNTVLNDSDIDVDVKAGVVTLNGTVKSAEAKTKAVSTAKATDGVKSVNDNLRVAATR
jgi:hyperosmotically inducible protein